VRALPDTPSIEAAVQGGAAFTFLSSTFLRNVTAAPWLLPALRALCAGAVAGLVWAPLLSWTRLPAWGAALTGLPVGLTTLLCFFFMWPHEWQSGRLGAWSSARVVAGVYWYLLVPAGLIGGLLTAWWCRRVPLP
jgi:hypothetical protein